MTTKKPTQKVNCPNCNKLVSKAGLEKHKKTKLCCPLNGDIPIVEKIKYANKLKEQLLEQLNKVDSTISELSEINEKNSKINLQELTELTQTFNKTLPKKQSIKKNTTKNTTKNTSNSDKTNLLNKQNNDFNNINPVLVETLTENENIINKNNTKLPQSILKKGVNFNDNPSVFNIKNNHFDSISDDDIIYNQPNKALNLFKSNPSQNENYTFEDSQFSNSNSDNIFFNNIKDLQIYGKKYYHDIKNGKFNKDNYKNKFIEFVREYKKIRNNTQNTDIEKDLHAICLGIQKYCNVSEYEIKNLCNF